MKIIQAMEEMPHYALGLTAQAGIILKMATPDMPVLVVDLEGKRAGAAKTAFSRAAKLSKQKVDFQLDEKRLLVKVLGKK